MSSNEKIDGTQKNLISRFVFSLETELEAEDCKNLYDDQFLIRMGKEATKFNRSYNKMTVFMIIVDTLVLLILSGEEINFKIWGNEIATFPGIIEIGLFLASFAFLHSVIKVINFEIHKKLIQATLKKKYPENNPKFYMGSLFPNDYAIDLLNFVPVPKLFAAIATIILGIYSLHAIAVCWGSIYIWSIAAFGSLTSKLIVAVLLLINLSGLSFFCVALVEWFESQSRSENTESN